MTVTAAAAIITRDAATRIVERTGLPLKLVDEDGDDAIGLLALMLEGNLRGYSALQKAKRAPTSAELRDYFERVDRAAAALIAALGMSAELHEGEAWSGVLAAAQPWSHEWQWIDDPPGTEHQVDINSQLFRVLREARRQHRQFATAKVKTRGPEYDNRWLITDLAGVFETTFGSKPTTTSKGPFVRFVQAYVDAIASYVALPPLSSDAIVEILKLPKRRK